MKNYLNLWVGKKGPHMNEPTREQIEEAKERASKPNEYGYGELVNTCHILLHTLKVIERERNNTQALLDTLLGTIGEVCKQEKPDVSMAIMYIKSLKSMADEYYKTKSERIEWVNVNNKLPEYGQLIVELMDDGDNISYDIVIFNKDEEQFMGSICNNVTHWLPVPKFLTEVEI